MEAQIRNCQNCTQSFTIEPEDFDFYKKIGVPPPTWCPECRSTRRMAWREDTSLYRGICRLCGKAVVTVHAPGGPFIIYCRECYKSDKWDPLDYGREYDFNKPFFAQYRELMKAVPRPALTGSNLVNSDFSHGSENIKNCYYIFWSYFSENAQNCWGLLLSKNAYDCYVADNSDHAYEVLHSNRLYKVRFGYFSDDCLEASFIFNCVGCSDCFGCVNLRKQKYCLFNEKLSKEEYVERLKYWDLGSYKKLEEAKEKFRTLCGSLPHRFAHTLNSQNVTGDIIRDAKDCKVCFSALDGVQNCKYLYAGGLNLKDSMDVTAGGDTSELLYEAVFMTGNVSRCFFSVGGGNCRETWYCDWADNSSHLFGCISLKNKQYCILNKQYAREEYERLIEKIKQHMNDMPYVDKKGRVYKFGEFFPAELSAYAYNESYGFPWYPKNKEEVIAEGWQWRDPPARSYKISVSPSELPDHISDAKDTILDEIIGCAHEGKCNDQCATAFRIAREELEFYREMNIALPRLCPNCRYVERRGWRNGYSLWKRKCQCVGSALTHADTTLTNAENNSHSSAPGPRPSVKYVNTCEHFHGDSPCPNEFETAFSPDKPEIVYCDACYKNEFF